MTLSDTTAQSGCFVASPTLVYAWTRTREEFNAIALPEQIHDWKIDTTVTLLRGNGETWERRTLSKSLDSGFVYVVFQFLKKGR